jgi:hypothetical protein
MNLQGLQDQNGEKNAQDNALGIPLIGLGTIPNQTTSTCHLCDTTWRHMFMINANDKT